MTVSSVGPVPTGTWPPCVLVLLGFRRSAKANALADALDQVIAAHAAADGVTYKSAIGAFIGHAVCSFSPWLNGLNLFNTGESYHPTRSGQSSGYLPLVTAVTG